MGSKYCCIDRIPFDLVPNRDHKIRSKALDLINGLLINAGNMLAGAITDDRKVHGMTSLYWRLTDSEQGETEKACDNDDQSFGSIHETQSLQRTD